MSRDHHQRLKRRDTLWKLLRRVRKLQITNSRIRVTGYYHCVVTSSSWSIYSTATRSWIICYSLQSSNTEFLRWKRYPVRLAQLIAISSCFHWFFNTFEIFVSNMCCLVVVSLNRAQVAFYVRHWKSKLSLPSYSVIRENLSTAKLLYYVAPLFPFFENLGFRSS